MNPGFTSSLLLGLSTLAAAAQGTFVYDQQSSVDEPPPPFGVGGTLQNISPGAGQSFIPALDSVNFVKLLFDDSDPADGLDSTVGLNIRSGAIDGAILGSAQALLLPNGFRGAATFLFSAPVPMTPGLTYFLDVVPISGAPINLFGWSYNYTRGFAYANGQPQGGSDLWFREGIIVPEPSAAAILLLGGLLLALRRRPPT